MIRTYRKIAIGAALLSGMAASSACLAQSMAVGLNGYTVSEPLFTVGETIGDYTPPGILDGMGAYELDENTIRVYCNHELLNFRGYEYQIDDGMGGTYGLLGARVSYFDIDKTTMQVVASDLAYDRIYDQTGAVASDASFFSLDFDGFSRFCSASLFEAEEFGDGRGLADRVFITSEEDGGFFNSVGANRWMLDTVNHDFWALPDLGRGAWENTTIVDSGSADIVAVLNCDDTSPFDFNPDAGDGAEAAPLFLYVGTKDPDGDFPARNGMRGGTLYCWVSDTGELSPIDFNGSTGGTLTGTWVALDNSPTGTPSEDGSTGYDEFGYPTQGNLWIQAKAVGAFGFSRPEDCATNPVDGTQAVFVSTGVDTYDVDPMTGDGIDTFGTVYLVDLDFSDMDNLKADISIIYDGDFDPTRALRSVDNLDWADDGYIYAQEDEAEEDTLTGEPLFGPGAVNPNEAGIVRLDPATGETLRVANIDRDVVLDGSIADPTAAVDVDAGFAGEWESAGIIDVSTLFDRDPGTLFLFNIQAHGIEDQEDFNPESRINDDDLVEGGQLLFLEKVDTCPWDIDGDGNVGPADLALLLGNWGPAAGSDADFDGDDVVGPVDLAALLGNWGPCDDR